MDSWIILRYDLFEIRLRQNENETDKYDDYDKVYFKNFELFWAMVCITASIAMVAVVGNSIVIFAVIKRTHLSAKFRYLNRAVLSLAIADFTLSLFGTPFSVVYWYWGKQFVCF